MRAPDGREVSRSFGTKREARAWLESERSMLRRGDWIDPRAGEQTLTDLCWEVHDTKIHLRERTLELYSGLIRNQIDPTIGGHRIGHLSPELIQRWVTQLAHGGLGASTVRSAYNIVGHALRYAVKHQRLAQSPAIDINLPALEGSIHRYLEMSEVDELAEAMPGQYRPFVYIGALAGLRPGEIRALRWDQVDLAGGKLSVVASLSRRGNVAATKTKTSRRTLSMPASLTDMLRAHRSRATGEFVVATPSGAALDKQNFSHRVWRTTVAKSVGPPMRPHDLRHTHAALLIATGAHPKTIQMRLGHRDIRTTLNVYGHLMDGLDEQAAIALDQLRGLTAI